MEGGKERKEGRKGKDREERKKLISEKIFLRH